MANQYCKITSWIQHHKDHGDSKYAEAISDLCLDSWLSPSRYPGLTFLYQTNKKLRKEFCEKVFTPDSREIAEEFKRYILPDIFHSCEDFQKKDVGNVLGYKYAVKSCDKHKVVFENGMEIHPLLHHNSYEPMNPKLKDIIKIYYVVKGEPPESGDHYKIQHSSHRGKRSSPKVMGGTVDQARVAVSSISGDWRNAKLMDAIKEDANLDAAYYIFHKALLLLITRYTEKQTIFIRNLILLQWFVNTNMYGILTYIPAVIMLLRTNNSTEAEQEPELSEYDVNTAVDVIKLIIDLLNNNSISFSIKEKDLYFTKLVSFGRNYLEYDRVQKSTLAAEKVQLLVDAVADRGRGPQDRNRGENPYIAQFFNSIIDYKRIWGFSYPELHGEDIVAISKLIKNILILQMWAIDLFIIDGGYFFSQRELTFKEKLDVLYGVVAKIMEEDDDQSSEEKRYYKTIKTRHLAYFFSKPDIIAMAVSPEVHQPIEDSGHGDIVNGDSGYTASEYGDSEQHASSGYGDSGQDSYSGHVNSVRTSESDNAQEQIADAIIDADHADGQITGSDGVIGGRRRNRKNILGNKIKIAMGKNKLKKMEVKNNRQKNNKIINMFE